MAWQGIKISPIAYSFYKSAKSRLFPCSLLGFCSPLPALLLVILAALPFTLWVLPGLERSLSAVATGPGVEEEALFCPVLSDKSSLPEEEEEEAALLCPVLCGKSFLPEEEERAVLASAPLSTGDTDGRRRRVSVHLHAAIWK